ncbi:MAG TPA: DUF4382 domain-containing protein [Gemmatimonadales bacterium]|nr:DUF4382 domain-containing protein [Gemmatimonadales bacterium]
MLAYLKTLLRTCSRWGAVGAAALGACSGDGSGPGTGRLTLLLTDAPGDIKAAVVTIAAISLQGPGGTVVLRDDAITTDLLTLADATAELVEEAEIPAGTYSQLRFVVTGAYIEVENDDGSTSIYASSPDYAGLPPGATVAGGLQMPSFGTSGLKVTMPGDELVVPEGGTRTLLVDFDVAQSFGREAGGSGQWVMHPVITATDVAATGTIAVSVSLADGVALPAPGGTPVTPGDFSAAVSDGVATVSVLRLTDPDGDGIYGATFPFLEPGTYLVDLLPAPGLATATTTPATPATITVHSGATVTVALTLTEAS